MTTFGNIQEDIDTVILREVTIARRKYLKQRITHLRKIIPLYGILSFFIMIVCWVKWPLPPGDNVLLVVTGAAILITLLSIKWLFDAKAELKQLMLTKLSL